MDYPSYTMNDLKMVPKDGTFEYEDFHGLIADLLEKELLDNDVEIGISKFIIDNGTASLSPKQGAVVDNILSRHTGVECNRCGLEIPLSEIIFARDNGGFCGYCDHQNSKDTD